MKDIQNIKKAKQLNFKDYLSALDFNPTDFIVLDSLFFFLKSRSGIKNYRDKIILRQ
jgi:hypothetical protein